MQLYKLNKTVLSIRNNPAQFLNGITSNVLDEPQNAFLNIHGRIIATISQVKIDDSEFWIIVETPVLDALFGHIEKFVKLSGVRIEKLDKYVYFDLDKSAGSTPGVERIIPQPGGQIIVSRNELIATISDEAFTLFRLKNNLAMQCVDYTDEFILNVGAKGLVSFAKGCFLGQEPVSKVHNRSRPTWQLVVKYEDECSNDVRAKMTSKVLDPDTNRVLGFVFIPNNPGPTREGA